MNDLYLLDVIDYSWSKLNATGLIPRPREGAVLIKRGNEIFLIGGCNY